MFAQFESPTTAMKFIKSQKKTRVISSNKLRVSENRFKTQRLCCKCASNLKKKTIELGDFAAKEVTVSYKSLRVVVKVDGKIVPVACFDDHGCSQWVPNSVVNEATKEAMETVMAEME